MWQLNGVGSGVVGNDDSILLKSTAVTSEECVGMTSRLRHCCNDCWSLADNKVICKMVCGLRLSVKLMELILAILFEPEKASDDNQRPNFNPT